MNELELTKLSAPGWEKTFNNEIDLYNELKKHICKNCFELFLEEYGLEPDNLEGLLWTPCGSEYMVTVTLSDEL